MAGEEKNLEALLREERQFAPPPEFTAAAVAGDAAVYERAAADPEAYWAGWARELTWFEPFEKVLEWKPPHAKWFADGKLNAAYNCLDRHLDGPRR